MDDLAGSLNLYLLQWMDTCPWRRHESGAWVSERFTGMENLDSQSYVHYAYPLPGSEEKRSEIVTEATWAHMRATSRFDVVWPWKQDESFVTLIMAKLKVVAERSCDRQHRLTKR